MIAIAGEKATTFNKNNPLRRGNAATNISKEKNEMDKKGYLALIMQAFCKEFDEHSLRLSDYYQKPWKPEESSFKSIVANLGLKFVEVTPDSLNCDMFLIAKYDYDDEGFMVQKNICIYRRVIGVYGGCLVQLKDVEGNELMRRGRIS